MAKKILLILVLVALVVGSIFAAGQADSSSSGSNFGSDGRCVPCSGHGLVTCRTCGGRGSVGTGNPPLFCGPCEGSGLVRCSPCNGRGRR